MGKRTGIGWTQHTWNPWVGCTKVSPGCAHCYMFYEQARFGKDPSVVYRTKTMRTPFGWHEPSFVFTCSWSDWFHKVADEWREEAWETIKQTPHLTYQILTKRPGRIARHLPGDWGDGWPNVWLGVSVESRAYLNRVAVLCDVPAAVHFVSAEPLLGSVRLYDFMPPHGTLQWVIGGGESGADARPCNPEWLRTLRDDCQSHAVPFFLKQLGGFPNPRAHALAVLDGKTHTEMPPARAAEEGKAP